MTTEIMKPEVKLPTVELNLEDIKKYIAPKATDQELYMFVNIAKSYGLNPFKREIHFVKYGENKANIVVGYEIYLKRAESTGKLDGWKCWVEKEGQDEKAIIEIQRKDWKQPFRWEVYRKEFDQKQANWNRMPSFMLKKVAIAQGFRLAFPEDMGGMPYIPEEINGQASEELEKEKIAKPENNDIPDFQPHSPTKPPQKAPEDKKAHQGQHAGSLISVQEKINSKKDSPNFEKPYWSIKHAYGDAWTYDPEIAQLAIDAVKTDSQMVWELTPKGQMINLKIATMKQ